MKILNEHNLWGYGQLKNPDLLILPVTLKFCITLTKNIEHRNRSYQILRHIELSYSHMIFPARFCHV